jgi:D-3-phosphoglycerate dehydrogenase
MRIRPSTLHLYTTNTAIARRKMSAAKDIVPRAEGATRSVSNSWSASQQLPTRAAPSTSPSLAFHSPPTGVSIGPFGGAMAARAKSLTPFATEDIKVLLLENVNATGQDLLRAQGYQVEALTTSLGEDELIARIKYRPSPRRNPD